MEFSNDTTIGEILEEVENMRNLLDSDELEDDDILIDDIIEVMDNWKTEYHNAFNSPTRFWKEYNKKLRNTLEEVL